MLVLLVASAKVLGSGPDVATVGVGGNGALYDETQLRLEDDAGLGPSADQMLASFGDGSALANISLAEAEGELSAAPAPAPSQKAVAESKAKADDKLFAESVGDLLSLKDTVKTSPGAPASAATGPPVVVAPASAPDLDDPHSALTASALEQKSKSAMWSHATLQAVQVAASSARSLSNDHWATSALRTTGGIVATIDDDYPYQCHCSRKSTHDAVAAGMISPSTPGSLSETSTEAGTTTEGTAAATSSYTGVCTHHPDEECMAIPGDHAALLSVALLALG